MNKLVMYFLVCLLLVSSVLGASKHDFVELVENTDYCFDCYTIYKITKADDTDLTKIGIDFVDAKREAALPHYEVSYLKTEEYIDYVDEYEPCTLNKTVFNNETEEEEIVEHETECYVDTVEVRKIRSYYEPILTLNPVRDAYNNADVDDTFYIKISGKLKPGEALDNILVLNDYVYDEYVWWNSSFNYRRKINCTNLAASVPVVINGSTGFKIDGLTQIVWTYCAGDNTSVYYNNNQTYVVANDTAQIPFEVELGNGTSYNPASVWNDRAFLFTNGCVESSNNQDNCSITGSVTNNKSEGRGGGSYEFSSSGNDNYINFGLDNVYEAYNNMTWFISLKIVDPLSSGSNRQAFPNTFGGAKPWFTNYFTKGDFSVSDQDIMFREKNGGDTRLNCHITQEFNDSQWHDYALKKVGDTLYFYMDGVLINSSTGWGDMPHSGWNGTLGSDYYNNFSNYKFYVDNYFILDNDTYSDSVINQTHQNMINTVGFGNLGAEESPGEPAVNESEGREAIVEGLDSSEIAGSYTAHEDKQVYIRLMNGSQYKGTFDKYVVYTSGSTYKRWAFNYDENSSSSFPAFYNITPVFYIWQKYNMTYDQIKWDVSVYINSTYP